MVGIQLILSKILYLKEVVYMDSGNKFMVAAAVVIGALVLQVVLIFADRHDSPGKAAVEFSKAYFKQKECMTYRLCNSSWILNR